MGDKEKKLAMTTLPVKHSTAEKNQDENYHCLSDNVKQEQSMLTKVKELKKMKASLQEELEETSNKLHLQAKKRVEIMQRQQMEQRMRKLKKANRSKTRRRHRKRRKADATSCVLATCAAGDGQASRWHATAPSKVRVNSKYTALVEEEDEGVSVDTNEAAGPAEGKVQWKEECCC